MPLQKVSAVNDVILKEKHMQQMELDSIPAAGILRMNCDGPTSYTFNCHVPISVKENDTADYVCSLLDAMKDQVRERKSWRFKERRQRQEQKQEKNDKPKHYDKPIGKPIRAKLEAALNKKKNG